MFKARKEIKELKLFINEMEEQHKKRIQELEQIEKEISDLNKTDIAEEVNE